MRRHALIYLRRVKIALEDFLQAWKADKVDFNKALIFRRTELLDDKGLADLPRALDKQAFPMLAGLPIQEELIDFTLKHLPTSRHMLRL